MVRDIVTKDDCERCNNNLSEQLKTITNALIGEDLQSGLVKKFSDLETQVKIIVTQRDAAISQRDKARESRSRWRISAFGAAMSLFLFILGRVL